MGRIEESEFFKKLAVDYVIEQLLLRGESALPADRFDRHDIVIPDKDIKIKVKFNKPRQRSRSISPKWEFSDINHRSRLWPIDVFDFYILVGFNDYGKIEKIWKISADDDIIYRKNQIFIASDKYQYQKYELKILEDNSEHFKWIE